ncbi:MULTISPECIES: hypothetical protein [Ramlibacter]|uniref:Tetratricopeptide repeat protein n=1 Tax=Ramlibacter aquaticus TaxID=2780094 RepID=A0ABR9SCR9_9BURK|nr:MULTISPECIES: hypothetical protein [Ramlibacter]MBE7940152.1 hypothetical protein [Ramlibacter aquaticus]
MGRTSSLLRATASMAAAGILLAACASTPQTGAEPAGLWQDAPFFASAGDDPAVTRQSLYALPPELRARLAAQVQATPGRRDKLRILLATVYGPDGVQAFRYRAGHSTVAADTWREARGDCLSLTVLAYAVARALDMPAQMQEVDGPWLFDRQGQMDFVNSHVNLLLPGALKEPLDTQAHDIAIDFEPDMASRRRGRPLDENEVLARYFNNVAVQAFAAGERKRAYAHFRAAARAQPGYAAVYANLAALLRADGHEAAAEASLRHALALAPDSWVALQGLHALVLAQGRVEEAAALAKAIAARQALDPDYWIGRGREALLADQPQAAVRALERAREISIGHDELHRLLAVAYGRVGDGVRADAELRTLVEMGLAQEQIGLLRRKIQSFLR